MFYGTHVVFRCAPDVSGEGRLRRRKLKRGHRRCQVRAPNGAPHHSTREGVGAQLEVLHASVLSGGHRTYAPDGEQCQRLVLE